MKPHLITALLKASFTLKLVDKKATPRFSNELAPWNQKLIYSTLLVI